CGPASCPRCNPRVAAYLEAARGAVTLPRTAPVNVPPDALRASARGNGSAPANLRPIGTRSENEKGDACAC
ncbi:MAG: hypothetical protein QHJ73_18320, partial [Armatimonadota bacterium]|nr:hypothetical protein [Armatimonadota bacterium]